MRTKVIITTNKMNVGSLSAISANLGSVTIGTTGHLASQGTSWATGTGIFLGRDGGTYKFRVGSTSGSRLLWDGSELEVRAGGISIDDDGLTAGAVTLNGGGLFVDNFATVFFGACELEGGSSSLVIRAPSEILFRTNGVTRGYWSNSDRFHTGNLAVTALAGGGDRALRVTNDGHVYAV